MEQLSGLNLETSVITVIGVVVVIYTLMIAGFGSYFSRFSKNINDFFYSGQRFAWWLGAASMIATGIGSYSYLKYSQQGFETGMSSSMTYTNDWFIIPFFMFGWLPIIYFSKIKSIPEYFERRFNRTSRYISLVIIMAYMLFYIGYNLFTIGVAMEGLLGIPMIYTVPIATLILGGYVTFGGQTAVIFTDLVQGIMLYLAGGIAIVAGIVALGGFGEFWSWLPVTHRLPFVHLLNDPKFNTAGLFWGEALAGSIAFTFMNQGFIMRYLALKSVNDGRKAAIFNVLFTLPFSAIIVGAVGWIAKSLITKQAAMGGVLEGLDPIHITNHFHTFLVVAWETLRHNAIVFGFVIAALTAALMSTVDTLINACAAIGIYDIYKPLIKPKANDKHYLIAARWVSGITALIGLVLVYMFSQMKGSLMSIHYKGIMIIIPSIVTTIFLGAFWRRFTAKAANISMIVGSSFTVLTVFFPKMIDPLAWFVSAPMNGKYIYSRALFGMTLTAIVGIVITLTTKQTKEQIEQSNGLTIDTLDYAMEQYKGGIPNHVKGEKVKRLPVLIDESIPFGKISLSKSVMERMKANVEDLIYMEDSRWILGGLRSDHVKAYEPHDGNDEVKMNLETFEKAMMLKDKPITLEKIF
ncbi:MAG: sodium:solute symporter family protein [Candidatus Cloacimonadota bacterium]|nr:MAG: sodium:solute symporter family protein [Candidatus Cloacimonadota bacterium]